VLRGRDEHGRRPFFTLLEADEAAARGQAARALTLSAPLLELDSAGLAGDPFWALAAGDSAAAARELLWHQNSDIVHPTQGVAQPVDVDWAFGTLGRWRQSRLLMRVAPRATETCAALFGVARLWGAAPADPLLVRRALLADSVRRAQGCVA
jgi:hypothetical protein